jgi:hypothetical protein
MGFHGIIVGFINYRHLFRWEIFIDYLEKPLYAHCLTFNKLSVNTVYPKVKNV